MQDARFAECADTGYTGWYRERQGSLSSHGLWLRGGEWNTLPLSERYARHCRVLITRLSTYLDTSESFTHPLLYQALADVPGVYPDFAYLPPPKDGEIMTRDGVPWLLGTQSKRGPDGFDVIAFSNAIVQELVNLPTLLARSGLDLTPAERLSRPDVPLLLLGGANSLHTSLLDHAESPVDGIFTGDQLSDIQRLMALCAEAKREGVPKDVLLERLESVPGFARPGQGKPVRKNNKETLDLRRIKSPRPSMYKLEGLGQEPVAISRGCPAFCSFCAESFDLKPYRENPVDAVVKNALDLKRDMGLEGVDLFSFNFNFYQDLYPLMEALARHFPSIGLKSQRFDMIAHDPDVLDYLRAVGKGSLTFGMEGISARLRRYLQKGLEEEDLWTALRSVLRRPIRELKVFTITTGVESEEDFAEFEDFVKRLPTVMRSASQRPRVIFSATPLVRFPWTPLEFAPAPLPEVYARSARRIGHIARMAGFEYRGAADEAENYISQVLVRADRPGYWAALRRAVGETGFVYYREVQEEFMDALRSALAAEGIGDDLALGGFDLEESRKKPWSRWETGVRRQWLHVQYKRARRFVDPGYCLGTTDEEASCLACTACEDKEEMALLTGLRRKHASDAEGFDGRRKAFRQSALPMSLEVHWGAKAAGLPRKYAALVLASALMRAEAGLVPHFWRFGSSLSPASRDLGWVAGLDRVALEWLPEGEALLRDRLRDPAFLERVNAALGDWGELIGEVLAHEIPLEPTYLFVSPFRPNPDAYAKALGLRFTLRKQEGRTLCEWSKDSLKKRIVNGMEWIQAETEDASGKGVWEVTVDAGPKFDPEVFLQKAFALSDPGDWVRIRSYLGGQRGWETAVPPDVVPSVEDSTVAISTAAVPSTAAPLTKTR